MRLSQTARRAIQTGITVKKFFSISIMVAAVCRAFAGGAEIAAESAHRLLWEKYVGPDGLILDYSGEIPSPKDIEDGVPNFLSWWSPIENGAKFTGLYIAAACRRAEDTGNESDIAKARKLAKGLMLCASVSDVKGFVARGVGTDGKSHYPFGSEDQTVPWLYGMYSYYKSRIPSEAERAEIRKKFAEICEALDANSWNCPCDGKFAGDSRGNISGFRFLQTPCYLFCLRAAYLVTGDEKWEKKYRAALRERNPRAAPDAPARLEICARGYRQDEGWLKNIDAVFLWIYVKNYAALRALFDAETDPEAKRIFREGLERGAADASGTAAECEKFDNSKNGEFKLADWRRNFGKRPQNSQKEVEKVALGQLKIPEIWERRNYERRFMTIPLSAAAICAFSGNPKYSDLVEKAVARYDYSKVNLGEMFLAEVALSASRAYAPKAPK